MGRKIDSCRACGAPIFFGLTAKNEKQVPLDAEAERRYVQGKSGKWHVADVHTTHFQTCPNADLFRNRQPKPPDDD